MVVVVAFNFTKSIRDSFYNLLRAFFKPAILGPLLLAAVYTAGEVWLLKALGIWSVANLKTTFLWLLTFAFVTMFQIVGIKDHNSGVRKISRDVFAVTVFFLFVTELHNFSWYIELFAMPLVTLIFLLAEVAKFKPEHSKVASLLGCMTGLIGLGYFGYSLSMTITNWPETATRANASEFAIPIALSVGFLPFLYAWRVYVAYNSAFTTISIFGLDKSLVPYARWLATTRIGGDIEFLERWRKVLQSSRPTTKAELKHSLVALRALKAREALPSVVQPHDGWSPYLAMQFMSDYGFDTGYYQNGFGHQWFASSPMREIGDGTIWKNNIAYYIEGIERSANMLKLKLNINDPAKPLEARKMFIIYCLHLLEQAMSVDAVERLKANIVKLEPFKNGIPYGSVTMTREDFVGGIKDGYSLKFEIERG